jgi:hypothetical protein
VSNVSIIYSKEKNKKLLSITLLIVNLIFNKSIINPMNNDLNTNFENYKNMKKLLQINYHSVYNNQHKTLKSNIVKNIIRFSSVYRSSSYLILTHKYK